MGTWYLLAWMAWSCPGGWASRFIPEAAKPIVCRPGATESLMFLRKDDALAKVQELGPYALPTLAWCQTGLCYTKGIDWKLTASQRR